MEFILNERSLYGQFEDASDFFVSLKPVVKCMEVIRECSTIQINRISNFHECQVTANEKLCDLKAYGVPDELLRLKLSLDNEVYDKPQWDKEPVHDLSQEFVWNEENVTATALAEAAITSNALLSFESDEFKDCILLIKNNDTEYNVNSIHTPKYLVEEYNSILDVGRKMLLQIRYEGTRIDCSMLEEKYGVSILEKSEFEGLISTLDKFVEHESWESIGRDDGLEYKKYTPKSKEDNWFKAAKYKDKTIMKFRFSSVMRCFGYRKDDRFRILRLERDHRVSDNG